MSNTTSAGKFLKVPKLRVWHFLGIVAAIACYLSVYRYREDVFDPYSSALRQIRQGDGKSREEATARLGGKPSSPETFESLIHATNDPEPRVRGAAARMLGVCLDEVQSDRPPGSRVEILPTWQKPSLVALEGLLKDGDAIVRFRAAAALVELKLDNEPALSVLRQTAHDRTSPERWIAIGVLAIRAWDDPDARAEILEGARSSDRNEHFYGMTHLWAWSRDREVPEEVFRLLGSGLKDPEKIMRETTFGSLTRYGRNAGRFIPELVQALNDPSGRVRDYAFGTLTRIGIDAEPALPAMKRYAEAMDSTNREIKQAEIARFEGQISRFRDEFLPGAKADLMSNDAAVRRNAAALLAMAGPPARALLPELLDLLGDLDAKVRLAAVNALLQIDPVEARDALAKAAESDPDERVRAAALGALPRP